MYVSKHECLPLPHPPTAADQSWTSSSGPCLRCGTRRFGWWAEEWGILRKVSCYYYNLMSKLVPQPQLLVAPGMPVTLNWLPISSMV